MYYFTSDTHWYHRNIIKFCNRPFRDENEMNEELIAQWNAVVSPNDTIYHLGDVAFTQIDKLEWILSRLNGKTKHFLLGNHDSLVENNAQRLIEKGLITTLSHYVELKVNRTKLVLCHYAFSVWNKSHHGSYNLYGHSHSTHEPYKCGKQMDVGVDNAYKLLGSYRPFSFTEIDRFLSKTDLCKRDKHERKSVDMD